LEEDPHAEHEVNFARPITKKTSAYEFNQEDSANKNQEAKSSTANNRKSLNFSPNRGISSNTNEEMSFGMVIE
jgi:hypothetical protein